MVLLFILQITCIFIELPAGHKYIDATTNDLPRAFSIQYADSIDLYTSKNSPLKVNLNIRDSNLFLTVKPNKVLAAEKRSHRYNQDFGLVVDSSGYNKIIHGGLCLEHSSKKNFFLFRRCIKSAAQLFDFIPEESVVVPDNERKKKKEEKVDVEEGEPITTSFIITPRRRSQVVNEQPLGENPEHEMANHSLIMIDHSGKNSKGLYDINVVRF